MLRYKTLTVVFFVNILLDSTLAEGNYYLQAAKNVPRIGRSSSSNKNSNIDQMGKFFMKVSKSVPRIGRRNEDFDYDQAIDRREQSPTWSDIADRFEYEPEVLTSPEVLEHLEMRDDPSAYDLDKIRLKRDTSHKKHPRFQY
ncbi:hypothetical protein BDFB_012577 [Asbolus verrucosus]|uniref:Uncharacterized protein n=1 Tax=Asbolus verrucosus TaxID=1661398 RepID=A0A482VZF3_ASBVE|nr:hypothetical protein BDFB_012577 [Asbolus verrucosus]